MRVVLAACAFVALCACSAHRVAAPSLTVQRLLSLSRQAMRSHGAPGLYHLRYVITSNQGYRAATDEYVARSGKSPYDFRIVTVTEGVTAEYGRLRGRRWRRDANGLLFDDVTIESPYNRVLAAAMKLDDTRVRIAGITDQLPHRYVVDAVPNARLAARMYFDAKTYLLTGVTQRDYDGYTQMETYDGFVDVGAVKVPTVRFLSNDRSSQVFKSTLAFHERIPYDAQLLLPHGSRRPFLMQRRLPAPLNTMFGESGILVRVDIGGTSSIAA
jgi:hypothetical protein